MQHWLGPLPSLTVVEPESSMDQEVVEHVQEVIQDGRWRRKQLRTPLRRAILDVETMPEKRRLGRRQQVLSDLGHKVREKEVELLSDGLTSPMLPRITPRLEVFLRAHTTTPATPFSKSRATTGKQSEGEAVVNIMVPQLPPPPPQPERSFFRNGGLTGAAHLHKSFSAGTRYTASDPGAEEAGRIRFSKGVHFSNANNRRRLLHTRDINGPVQLRLYTEQRANIRPLVITAFRSGLFGKDLNRVETFISSKPAAVAHHLPAKPQMFSTLRPAAPRRDKTVSNENPISSW